MLIGIISFVFALVCRHSFACILPLSYKDAYRRGCVCVYFLKAALSGEEKQGVRSRFDEELCLRNNVLLQCSANKQCKLRPAIGGKARAICLVSMTTIANCNKSFIGKLYIYIT